MACVWLKVFPEAHWLQPWSPGFSTEVPETLREGHLVKVIRTWRCQPWQRVHMSPALVLVRDVHKKRCLTVKSILPSGHGTSPCCAKVFFPLLCPADGVVHPSIHWTHMPNKLLYFKVPTYCTMETLFWSKITRQTSYQIF